VVCLIKERYQMAIAAHVEGTSRRLVTNGDRPAQEHLALDSHIETQVGQVFLAHRHRGDIG
jgi:hypothetical protein